jgi:hypothetical protein
MKRLIFPLIFILFSATTIFAQPKLKNNRFGNITPTEVTLIDSGEFFSDPELDTFDEELNEIFKIEDLAFIKSKVKEKMLPPAINTFEKREANRPLMNDYKLYELARVGDGKIVISIAPLSENQHMKAANMIGSDDVILVFGAAAFGEGGENNEPAIAIEEEDAALLVRPDIDYAKVKVKNLTETMRLKMPDGEGSNGTAVVWHPDLEKYYAAFAGNEGYPLAVFDKKGNRVSADDLVTGFDVRSLWYDAKHSQILGNGYAEAGWFRVELNKKPTIPVAKNLKVGQFQPEEHSVGMWDSGEKSVCFLEADTRSIVFFNEKFQENKRLLLQPGITEEANMTTFGELPTDYNSSTAIALGNKKTNFGLYHSLDGQIECYEKDKGLLTEVWKLPTDAPKVPIFNLAYANNIVWLFDQENRTWIGYK